jgi:hypothetical protein
MKRQESKNLKKKPEADRPPSEATPVPDPPPEATPVSDPTPPHKAEIKPHPHADLFPLMRGEGYGTLLEDIAKNGLLHPFIRS